jgi:hypothetical protein
LDDDAGDAGDDGDTGNAAAVEEERRRRCGGGGGGGEDAVECVLEPPVPAAVATAAAVAAAAAVDEEEVAPVVERFTSCMISAARITAAMRFEYGKLKLLSRASRDSANRPRFFQLYESYVQTRTCVRDGHSTAQNRAQSRAQSRATYVDTVDGRIGEQLPPQLHTVVQRVRIA